MRVSKKIIGTAKNKNNALRISQFQLRPAPPPPPPPPPPSPTWATAFARLVSPGGGAFAKFVLPGGRAFANPGAIPEL